MRTPFIIKKRNMSKKEAIWREILFQRRKNNIVKFTQKGLAQKFGFSLSTVFNALKPLRESHAVKITGRFFLLEDYRRVLYLAASARKLERGIYYRAFINKPVSELEGMMSPGAVFSLYSGYKFLFGSVPAEYDHLYIYAEKEKFQDILGRLPKEAQKSAAPNFFVIEPDSWFKNYEEDPLEQIFIDIWNAPEWYAKDFLRLLENKLEEKGL